MAKLNLKKFVEKAEKDTVDALEEMVNQQEDKNEMPSMEDVVEALRQGSVDLTYVRDLLRNRRYHFELEEEENRRQEAKQMQKERRNTLQSSPEFLAVVEKVKELKEEYESWDEKEYTVSFTVPVTAKVTLQGREDFVRFFDGEDFSVEPNVDDFFFTDNIELILGQDPSISPDQVDSIQTVLNDLGEYSCDLVSKLFPVIQDNLKNLFDKCKIVNEEYCQVVTYDDDVDLRKVLK